MGENALNPYLRGINWLYARIKEEPNGQGLGAKLEAGVQEANKRFSGSRAIDLRFWEGEAMPSIVLADRIPIPVYGKGHLEPRLLGYPEDICSPEFDLSDILNELGRVYLTNCKRKDKPENTQSIYVDILFTALTSGFVTDENFGIRESSRRYSTEDLDINMMKDDQVLLGKQGWAYKMISPEVSEIRYKKEGSKDRPSLAIVMGPRIYEGVKIQSEQMVRELVDKLGKDYELRTALELLMLCSDCHLKSRHEGVPLNINLRELPSYQPGFLERVFG
ncbi:MAG: hypothetical protein WCV90_02295 [Candidatus Woesearchaeota archaeon]|jgi:hypothetical protein